jgi:hypothetical protein
MKGSRQKSGQSVQIENEIVIPELEEAMKTYRPRGLWTEEDINAVKTYYGKVPTALLAATIHRTVASINKYAENHGIKANRK